LDAEAESGVVEVDEAEELAWLRAVERLVGGGMETIEELGERVGGVEMEKVVRRRRREV